MKQTEWRTLPNGDEVRAEYGFHYIRGNRRAYFSITGTVKHKHGGVSGGCVHETIAEAFPELAHLVRWHLVDDDGVPMHYVTNACFLAGDRDCFGYRKGEQRRDRNGTPLWHYVKPDRCAVVASEERPEDRGSWEPCLGEGKEPELDAARRAACWPDATDDDLTAPGLRERLLARLPMLNQQMRDDMHAAGVEYFPEEFYAEQYDTPTPAEEEK